MQNLDAEYVFISGLSEDAITDVKKPWMKVLKEAGISDFRFHD
jgi:hypothetical protein